MPSNSRSTTLAYLALGFGTVALGFSALFVRWANVAGPVSGFYRSIIAAAVLAWPSVKQIRQHRPLSKRHVALAVLAGLLFAGDLAAWNTGVLMTTAANATLFGNTSPFWVSLGALLLFKEKLRPAFWSGLGLAMLGSVIILGRDFLAHPTLGLGDMLALLAGLFYGGFFLATQRAREKLSSLASWWISALASAVALLGLCVILRLPLLGYSVKTYLYLIGLALVIQVVGYISINYALGHLPASMVSPTLLGQPIMTALLAVPFLGETITLVQVVGGLLVLAGVWFIHRTPRQPLTQNALGEGQRSG